MSHLFHSIVEFISWEGNLEYASPSTFFLIGWFILVELRNYIFCFFRCILPVKSRDCGQIKILGLILWYIGLFWVHRYLIIISVNPEQGCIGFNINKESIAIKLFFFFLINYLRKKLNVLWFSKLSRF